MITTCHKKGYIELRAGCDKRPVLQAYKSPNATTEEDMWLAWNLKKIYRKYYRKICLNNVLDFFGDYREEK